MVKPFGGILGNNSELRTIQYLLPFKNMEFNITELAEEVGVSRQTISKVVKNFVEFGILNVSCERSGVKYYQLDRTSPFVTLFGDLNNRLVEHMLGDEVLYQIHEYWAERAPRNEELRPRIGINPPSRSLTTNTEPESDMKTWPWTGSKSPSQIHPDIGWLPRIVDPSQPWGGSRVVAVAAESGGRDVA